MNDESLRKDVHMKMLAKSENSKEIKDATVVRLGFAVTIAVELIKSRDQQIALSDSERYDYNRLKTLEINSIDNYRKFEESKAGSPERIAAWIHQLSPWNLDRGAKALSERDQQIALEAAEHEIKQALIVATTEDMTIKYMSAALKRRLATLTQPHKGVKE